MAKFTRKKYRNPETGREVTATSPAQEVRLKYNGYREVKPEKNTSAAKSEQENAASAKSEQENAATKKKETPKNGE